MKVIGILIAVIFSVSLISPASAGGKLFIGNAGQVHVGEHITWQDTGVTVSMHAEKYDADKILKAYRNPGEIVAVEYHKTLKPDGFFQAKLLTTVTKALFYNPEKKRIDVMSGDMVTVELGKTNFLRSPWSWLWGLLCYPTYFSLPD